MQSGWLEIVIYCIESSSFDIKVIPGVITIFMYLDFMYLGENDVCGFSLKIYLGKLKDIPDGPGVQPKAGVSR